MTGKILVNGEPAEGVKIVFHPVDNPDGTALPSATALPDGSFVIKTWVPEDRVLMDGAPAGQHLVSCVWYPADLASYRAGTTIPDRLHGKYFDPKTSGLKAEVSQGPTELPPFQLEVSKN